MTVGKQKIVMNPRHHHSMLVGFTMGRYVKDETAHARILFVKFDRSLVFYLPLVCAHGLGNRATFYGSRGGHRLFYSAVAGVVVLRGAVMAQSLVFPTTTF